LSKGNQKTAKYEENNKENNRRDGYLWFDRAFIAGLRYRYNNNPSRCIFENIKVRI
jgi:hypothetical protein